jgi:hypothetical protein
MVGYGTTAAADVVVRRSFRFQGAVIPFVPQPRFLRPRIRSCKTMSVMVGMKSRFLLTVPILWPGDVSEGICYGFLVPIFFASLPFQIRFSLEPSFPIFSLAVIVVAVLGKLVGCGLGAILFKYNLWKSGFIRFGMNGHGAVDLVIVVVVLEEIQTLLAEGVIKAS